MNNIDQSLTRSVWSTAKWQDCTVYHHTLWDESRASRGRRVEWVWERWM